jgi:SEL1 protein
MGHYEEAVVAYIKAAEMGMEIGQSNAAWMLSRGYGVQGPAAASLAMKLHQRAAGQVRRLAFGRAALPAASGQIMPLIDVLLMRDRVAGLESDERAAQSGILTMSCCQGNVDALLQLGDSHWYGRGVNRSWSTAAQLYQAASKFGNAQALFNLGLMHEYGAGLPQVTTTEVSPPLTHEPDARV